MEDLFAELRFHFCKRNVYTYCLLEDEPCKACIKYALKEFRKALKEVLEEEKK